MGYGNYIDPFADARSQPGMTKENAPGMTKENGPGLTRYVVGAGEKLALTFVVLPGESRDIDVAIDLTGEGAEVELKGLYLCGGEETVNFRILMHHRAGGCVSRQLFNGIAGGSARVRFDGRIIVAPDAQQTEAYQENHNILLSEAAHVETTPQLEIYADDVKCSHGATIGRLDEDALFYMRTRGIPDSEAKVLQMISFLSPVTSGLEEDKQIEIEKQLHKMV